jgi:hypothetical protein
VNPQLGGRAELLVRRAASPSGSTQWEPSPLEAKARAGRQRQHVVNDDVLRKPSRGADRRAPRKESGPPCGCVRRSLLHPARALGGRSGVPGVKDSSRPTTQTG